MGGYLSRSEVAEGTECASGRCGKGAVTFSDSTFDGAIFTEVLEHIAIADPVSVIKEIARVLKPGATLLLTTPNVCNLANLIALAQGNNIFWAPEIFYGSTDRHNREYTPAEVVATVMRSGLTSWIDSCSMGPTTGMAHRVVMSTRHLTCCVRTG